MQDHPMDDAPAPNAGALDPNAGALDPKAGVLEAPNREPPELGVPKKLLLELAPNSDGVLLAPNAPPDKHRSSITSSGHVGGNLHTFTRRRPNGCCCC